MNAQGQRVDVRRVIATVIADLRASGDTGMVENLLEADVAIVDLIAASRILCERYSPFSQVCAVKDCRAALARVGGAQS